jgi:hypothetical protein
MGGLKRRDVQTALARLVKPAKDGGVEAVRQMRALYQAGINSGVSAPMSDDDWVAVRGGALAS